jgi:biotin carboxyl carrier protein
MNQNRLAEFDALIGAYYGKGGPAPDARRRVQDLLSTYYGNPAAARGGRPPSPAVSLSLGCDDGEVLSPPAPSTARSTTGEAPGPAAPLDFEEYVVDVCDAAPEAPRRASAGGPAAEAPRAAAPTPPPPAPPVPSPPPAPPAATVGPRARSSAGEPDIVSDIQSIISGQKVYDKERGLVERSTAASTDVARHDAPAAGTSGQPGNGHAIFDRIKQSMQYANAYDLGTVELENRFAEFDRQEDRRRRAPQKAGGGPATPSTPAAAPPRPAASPSAATDTADFMADLDAIQSKPAPPVVSRPFYDTGEHVLAGNGLYADRLRVGKGQAVRLSYGQIIAMGDLYDTVDDLLDADPAELNRLKTLIVRSTAYYEGKRSNPRLDVSNEEWDAATQGRYLKLAEGNYEHFSPPSVAMGSGLRTKHGDNRSQWEHYHRRAIEDAQQEYLAHTGNVSIFFERALIINAFGDHFLTDAFAAGHLVNKEVMIDRFRAAFYHGRGLSDAGEKFFDRVADRAWTGDLAAKFSKLETVDYPTVHVPWYVALVPGGLPLAGRDVPVPFHPNIDSASRFATVLKEAAKQQPERVGNLIVKALHDHLNEHGIEVTNGAGDGTWMLPGDGTLMVGTGELTPGDLAKNLGIMRKAVQQSIDDINSPSIRASNLNFQPFFDGVWRYVPQLTSASHKQMAALVHDYTDPGSAALVRAAADIVTAQLNSFVKLLIEEHKLQPA